jgi:hypothetical protein
VDKIRTVSSASGWSHMKSLNSSSATSASVSRPRLRCRARTRAPALPRKRRAEQYRRREAVPGSIQARSRLELSVISNPKMIPNPTQSPFIARTAGLGSRNLGRQGRY